MPVYVSIQRAHSVVVLGPGENGQPRKIRVGDWPHGVAVTPSGLLLVACWGGVYLVDVKTGETQAVAGKGRIQYHEIGISGDGKAYVSTGDHGTFLLVLDAETGCELGAVDNKIHGPTNLVVDEDGHLYVANSQMPYSIAVVENDSVAATISLEQRPSGLALSPNGTLLYIAEPMSGTIGVVDLTDRMLTDQIRLGGKPCAVAAVPEGKLYVVDSARNSVGVLDGQNQRRGWISVGRSPRAIAISSDKAYVVNREDGSLSVINIHNDQVAQTVSVGSSPWGVAAG